MPGLLVGEYPNLNDLAWLRDEHRVTAILSLQDDSDLAAKRLRLTDVQTTCTAEGLTYYREGILDGDGEMLADALPGLVAVLDGLLRSGACVYLHCNGGFNRAPTVAIAYLHAHRAMSIAEAASWMKSRRSCVPYLRAVERAFPAAT